MVRKEKTATSDLYAVNSSEDVGTNPKISNYSSNNVFQTGPFNFGTALNLRK